jgi:hypothetical protein
MTERDIHAQEPPPSSSCLPVLSAPVAQTHDPPLSPLSSCLIYSQLRFPSIERGLWCMSCALSSIFLLPAELTSLDLFLIMEGDLAYCHITRFLTIS